VALAATPLNARAGELRSGDRVRVFTSGEADVPFIVIGTVVSMDDETLVVRTDGQTGTIPLATVTSVDRSIGRDTHTGTGLAVGALSGVAVGLVVWNAEKTSGNATNDFDRALTQSIEASLAPAYILLFGGLGAAVGAAIGHASGTEQWDRVDSFTVGFAPAGYTPGTMTVSLDFGF